MNDIPDDVRALLACPRCQGALREDGSGPSGGLICDACALRFPVEEGIPVLLLERAQALGQG